jgi:hypothetical protein
MMSYEVKTPLLIETVEAARAVIAGVQNGAMDGGIATRILAGARVLQAAVAIDLKARLADPRIRAQEAKMIEAEKQSQQALPSA